MVYFPGLSQKLEAINRTLTRKIYIEAYNRILSEKVIVEPYNDKGEKRYLLGIKGVQNTFGAKAEDNACKTFELIEKYANHCGYKFNFLGTTFGKVKPLDAMIISEIDKEFFNTIKLSKIFKGLEIDIAILNKQLIDIQ